ncbi:hypothetical protein LTR84_003222 [Exophiala bonariae]|uniref:BZIP domain-containing protein n=1 Tax=Exophiala bonariae TaxID=1690606 RepID=A0AAV9NCV1_9EURO|nr:hypothetical protein LTR84_003222 [Exophiala bonariae]
MDSSQSSSSSSGTWASGRRLSRSQRERKRSSDRKRVRKRRAQDATLQSQLAEVTAERDLLRHNMALMSHALNNNPDAHGIPHGQTATEMLYNDPWQEMALGYAYNFPDIPLPARSMNPMTSFVPFPEPNSGVTPASVAHPLLPIETSTPGLAAEHPSLDRYIQDSALSSASNREQASDCQRILGQPVRMARTLTAKDVCTDASLNDDALISGVKDGWAGVEARYGSSFCPLWTAVKALDMRIFGQAGILTRLPCLKMIHSMLLVAMINLPGLRERAVFDKKLTQTNQFWTQLVYQFRLGFPAENDEDDAVSFDETTKRWSFTGLFLHHMYEIREWQMDPKFFDNWPGTYYDIVPLPEIGRSLPLPVMAGSASSPSDYQWQPAVVVGPRTGTRGRSSRAQGRQHHHILPLPVRRGAGKLLESDDEDELEEGCHALPWWS